MRTALLTQHTDHQSTCTSTADDEPERDQDMRSHHHMQNRINARSQHIEVQQRHRRRTMRTEGPRYEVVLAGIVLGVHYRSRKGNNTGSRHGNKES